MPSLRHKTAEPQTQPHNLFWHQVGAATETELKDKKLRYEDALNSVRSALELGIVPGGGACLQYLQRMGKCDAISFLLSRRCVRMYVCVCVSLLDACLLFFCLQRIAWRVFGAICSSTKLLLLLPPYPTLLVRHPRVCVAAA